MTNIIPEQILHLLSFPAERSATSAPLRIDGYGWSVATDERDGDFAIIAIEVHLPLLLKELFGLMLSPVANGRSDNIACTIDAIHRKARLIARIREDSKEPTKVQIVGAIQARAQTLLRLASQSEYGNERLLLRRHHRLSEDMLTFLNADPDPGEPASQDDLLHLTNRLISALPGRKVTQHCLLMYAAGLIDPVALADIEHQLDLQIDTLHFAGGTAAALPIHGISDKDADEDGGTWVHRRTTTHEEIQRFWRYHDPQVQVPVLLGSMNRPAAPATNRGDHRGGQSPTSSCLPVGDHSTDDHTSPKSPEVDLQAKVDTSANIPIIFSNRLPRF